MFPHRLPRLRPPAHPGALGLLAGLALGLAGCLDLRDYAGSWEGAISSDPALAHGFDPATMVAADVGSADRDHVAFSLAIAGGPAAPFVPIRRATGDALGEVQLPGEPLRTFFGFVQPTGQEPFLAVLSLFPENRLELRLIRGADDAYGVFSLHRLPGSRGAR